MRVWITRELRDLLFQGMELPAKIIEEGGIKDIFLREALPNDVAVLPFEEDYMDFLTEKKRRGLNNPVIFISTEPTLIQENLLSYNALLLDLKRTGKADIKNTLIFLFRLCSDVAKPAVPVPKEIMAEESPRYEPVGDLEDIRKVINYLINEGVSIIISFPILEVERPVTVRGSCKIRGIVDNRLLLVRFRPLIILKGLKEGLQMKAVFPAKVSYECTLNVLEIGEEEVLTSLPERLFIERRRFLRIEPSPERPVLLYILKHDEPSIPLQVIDISQRGVGFITGRDFNVREIYPVTVILPGGEVIVSYCAIRFKREDRDTFRYGAELFIHPKDEERIAEYVMKREIEIIQLLEG